MTRILRYMFNRQLAHGDAGLCYRWITAKGRGDWPRPLLLDCSRLLPIAPKPRTLCFLTAAVCLLYRPHGQRSCDRGTATQLAGAPRLVTISVWIRPAAISEGLSGA